MSSPNSHELQDPVNGQVSAQTKRTRRATRSSGNSAAPSARPTGSSRDSEEKMDRDGSSAEPFFGWSFRDFLVPYVLLALSMQRAHGYVIEQYLHSLGLVNVELSTLYRTLRQLEKNGLVYSTWEPGPEGPARRIYSLTEAGRWWLDAGANALAGYRDVIDRFFGNYAGPVRGPEGDELEKGASR